MNEHNAEPAALIERLSGSLPGVGESEDIWCSVRGRDLRAAVALLVAPEAVPALTDEQRAEIVEFAWNAAEHETAINGEPETEWTRFGERIVDGVLAALSTQEAAPALPERVKVLEQGLRELLAACDKANERAIAKLGGTVIGLSDLVRAESALAGERVVAFCGGHRNVLSDAVYVEPKLDQDWETQPASPAPVELTDEQVAELVDRAWNEAEAETARGDEPPETEWTRYGEKCARATVAALKDHS